jgi:ferric-dicitrate binding protein FerR (iron transport regulator)
MNETPFALPRPTDPVPADRLIELYVAGECTLAERAAMERWIGANPEAGSILRTMRDDGDVQAQFTQDELVRGLRSIRERMLERAESERQGDASNRMRGDSDTQYIHRNFRVWPGGTFAGVRTNRMMKGVWYTALGLCIAVAGVVVGWQLSIAHFGERHATPMTTYVTANGQRAHVVLSDGSNVVLNVASRLLVPADYSAGNHVLRLDGEALITVNHHSATPLTVMSGGVSTRVLGTSFAIRHYKTDTSVTVAVAEGKVSVGKTVVTARQLATVRRDGTIRMTVSNGSQFSFAVGVLTLPRMRLADAITELNRWYNVDIKLADPSLGEHPVEGRLPAGSLTDLENILGLTLNVRVVRDGRTLTLYPTAGE